MKLTTTFDRLKKAGVCEDGYKKLAKSLGGVTKYGLNTPINLLHILESNGVDDCLWALRATVEECEIISRLMAADFAESVLPIFEKERPDDKMLRARLATIGDSGSSRPCSPTGSEVRSEAVSVVSFCHRCGVAPAASLS
jgi:hypothetical protein